MWYHAQLLILEIEPTVLWILGKCSPIELCPQAQICYVILVMLLGQCLVCRKCSLTISHHYCFFSFEIIILLPVLPRLVQTLVLRGWATCGSWLFHSVRVPPLNPQDSPVSTSSVLKSQMWTLTPTFLLLVLTIDLSFLSLLSKQFNNWAFSLAAPSPSTL